MVKIKLFGTLRIKTGCKGLEADVATVKDACTLLSEKTGLPAKEFKNCLVVINGKPGKRSYKLADGDELTFFAPSGGG